MLCGMLVVMLNVFVKMLYMVIIDVLVSMFIMIRKYIIVIVVWEREERERENCIYLVLKCIVGDCRREDDRSK